MPTKRFKPGHVALERALSKLGLASRSQARKLIQEGRVRVGGKVIREPLHAVRPETARMEIDREAQTAAPKVFYLLHKPRGTVTTRSDPEGRKTIYDLLQGIPERIHPVGRLDFATSGLLLLTNDTRLSAFLTEPDSAIARTYLVTVRGELKDDVLSRWVDGVKVNGELLRARSARIQKKSKRETHLVIELTEGKNREIRRLCEAAGHEVTRLRRVAFGGLSLGGLAPGAFRSVSPEELFRAFPTLPAGVRLRPDDQV